MASKLKSSRTNNEKSSRLELMRNSCSSKQNKLLNLFWNCFQKDGKWPLARVVHSQNGGKKAVKEELDKLGGDVVVEGSDGSASTIYELTLIGILLTEKGKHYTSLLVSYLEFLRDRYQKNPEKCNFTDKEISVQLKLEKEDTKMLGKLVELGRLFGSAGRGPGDFWTIRAPDFIEDLPETGPLLHDLENRLLEYFKPAMPVSREERIRHQSWSNQTVSLADLGQPINGRSSDVVTVDALKRRYQVFVSSTYEDLKEERQHVIQALLETKCFPTGMEMFPASSVNQWDLIKRIIDECDYYVVIVAGRYGSLHSSGKSYTEMEFDYAQEIRKPIIGLVHKNIKSLTVEKSEEKAASKKKLLAFTEKVKQRVSRFWVTPADLGSAVKSAIFHELEFTPRPGWVRADVVPTSDTVEKLKQRIADLEEKLKHKKAVPKDVLPESEDAFEIPLRVLYDYQKVADRRWDEDEIQHTKEIVIKFKMTWRDIILFFADRLLPGELMANLNLLLTNYIDGKLELEIYEKLGGKEQKYKTRVDNAAFDRVLKTLMAKRYVSMTYPSHVYPPDTFWKFTPRGLQHLAELQAVRK